MYGLTMKKHAFVSAVISGILTIALAGALLVNFSMADPYPLPDYMGIVSPRQDTNPPQVSILSPTDSTTYYSRTIELNFSVSGPTGPLVTYPYVVEIHYVASWTGAWVYVVNNGPYMARFRPDAIFTGFPTFSGSLTLTDVPDGRHSVTVYANYYSFYHYPQQNEYASFYMTSSSMVSFTVDTTPPQISVLAPKNQTYHSADIPLDFIVDKPVSWLGYSLDGAATVTVPANTTLTGLAEGSHTLTVYAGNTAKSETTTFTIATSPTSQLIVASAAASAAAISFGLVAYATKRKKKKTPQ
jgi:hypothetical protein